jgi:hypothetical protein
MGSEEWERRRHDVAAYIPLSPFRPPSEFCRFAIFVAHIVSSGYIIRVHARVARVDGSRDSSWRIDVVGVSIIVGGVSVWSRLSRDWR